MKITKKRMETIIAEEVKLFRKKQSLLLERYEKNHNDIRDYLELLIVESKIEKDISKQSYLTVLKDIYFGDKA